MVAAAFAVIGLSASYLVLQHSSSIDTTVDRAKWALNCGNIVIAETSTGRQIFRQTSDLPNSPFRIVGFELISPGGVETLDPVFEETNLQTLAIVDFPRGQIPLERLANFAQLSELRLIRCGLRDEDIPWLLPLVSLRELDVSGNDQLSDAALQRLSELSNLDNLDVSSTDISPYGLKFLSGIDGLKSLGLEDCPVGDLRGLPSLPQLVKLKFSPMELNQEVVDRLAALPKLEVLDVSTGQLEDAGLFRLAELEGLKKLTISSDQVSQQGIERFRNLLPECEVVVK